MILVTRINATKTVKDIIALANGNVSVVGQLAYLIFGADNAVDAFGQRTCYDVGSTVDVLAWRNQLMQILHRACAPPISTLTCEVVSVNGQQLVVITVPASPLVYETIRQLRVKEKERKKRGNVYEQTYSSYTVFMRVGENVAIASIADRDVLRERKQRYFNESNKVSPVLFASGLGALVGWVVELDERAPPTLIERIRASVVGGVLGFLFGAVYRDGVKKWRETPAVEQIPPALRDPLFIGYIGAAAAVSVGVLRRRRTQ